MCSYEYRIRAVELFIKLGKRVRPTICQLYFPVKNSLKGWFREYEERLHLRWAMHAGAQVKAKKRPSSNTIHPRSMHRCHYEGIGLSMSRDVAPMDW